MKLTKGGVTFDVQFVGDIRRLKAAGYVEEVNEPAQESKPEALAVKLVSEEELLAMCEKAGVTRDQLVLESDDPSKAEVKAAIKKAVEANKDGGVG